MARGRVLRAGVGPAVTLLRSPRHRPDDLEHWEQLEELDLVNGRRLERSGREGKAREEVIAFAQGGPCYASVSWGKDSTVLAHLVWRAVQEGARIPLVHFRAEWWANPDCDLVRDAFLANHPGLDYDEIVMRYDYAREVHAHRSLYLEDTFREAARRYGERHLMGLRKSESRTRGLRMMVFGTTTPKTCAPIGWWSTSEVYAYLALHDLPVHPAYACTLGGLLDRDTLRVDGLAELKGEGHGRREWERTYYGAEVQAIEARARREMGNA